MESTKCLRVYPAFSLGRNKRTSALSSNHPFGSAPCSGRAELPAAWPDRLSLPAHLTSAVRLRGRYLGGESVVAVRNYCFFSFFTWPTRIHDARSDLNASRRNRITPSRLVRVLYQKVGAKCRTPSRQLFRNGDCLTCSSAPRRPEGPCLRGTRGTHRRRWRHGSSRPPCRTS